MRAGDRLLTTRLTIVLLLCGFTSSPRSLAAETVADVIARCEKSVVRIQVQGHQGQGLGSGFIVESDGLLVTNVHVLAGAQQAIAVFANGKSYAVDGTYLIDAYRDICIAKITASDLTPIALAQSLPRKGEQVIALGSPHGLSFSATIGIVSAIREEAAAKKQLGRPKLKGTWIQVDAALSGGNSGGPLVSTKGEVVGMSTLASQGAAQNLNFGISVTDIKTAIEKAKQEQLVPLPEGIGKTDLKEVTPKSSKFIARGEIPASSIEDYQQRGLADYAQLAANFRRAGTEAELKLKAMKKGQTFIPGGGRHEVAIQKIRKVTKYFFRSESVKKRHIAKQQELVKQLRETKKLLTREPNPEALLTLLLNGGPRLDAREENKIGFMDHGVVLHAYNDHDIAVLYDNAPYLMWVKSTAGLSPGQVVSPSPVYVAGTKTVAVPGRGSMSLTILNSVTETEIREVVMSQAEPVYRTWTDVSGKHKIEAQFVEVDASSKVVLKKRDGEVIKVPLSKLSADDVQRIKGN